MPANLIAKMTANNAPSPQAVGASSTYTTFAAYDAFDRKLDLSSEWFAITGFPYALGVDLGSGNAAAATVYKLTPDWQSAFSFAPKTWTFEGSNDGYTIDGSGDLVENLSGTWTTLDTRTNITFTAATNPGVFSFSNSTPYRYYRLHMTAGVDSTYVGIRELSIYTALNFDRIIVFDGCSRPRDNGDAGSPFLATFLGDCDHYSLPAEACVTVAVAGNTLANQLALASSPGGLYDVLDDLVATYPGKPIEYHLLDPINDCDAGRTQAAIKADRDALVAGAFAHGASKAFVYTTAPDVVVTGSEETVRLADNVDIPVHPPAGNTTIIDVLAITGADNTANATLYTPDQAHFTTAMKTAIADLKYAADPPVTTPTLTLVSQANGLVTLTCDQTPFDLRANGVRTEGTGLSSPATVDLTSYISLIHLTRLEATVDGGATYGDPLFLYVYATLVAPHLTCTAHDVFDYTFAWPAAAGGDGAYTYDLYVNGDLYGDSDSVTSPTDLDLTSLDGRRVSVRVLVRDGSGNRATSNAIGFVAGEDLVAVGVGGALAAFGFNNAF